MKEAMDNGPMVWEVITIPRKDHTGYGLERGSRWNTSKREVILSTLYAALKDCKEKLVTMKESVTTSELRATASVRIFLIGLAI